MKKYFTLLLAGSFFVVCTSLQAQIITTVAGNGIVGYNGDSITGPECRVSYPSSVTTDAHGNIYITDEGNHRIRKVDVVTNIMYTVAGNTLVSGYSSDSVAATNAPIDNPSGIVFDKHGNYYFCDGYNFCVRKVDAVSGIMTIVAGNGRHSGYNGDSILAKSAYLNFSSDVAVDSADNLYIADEYNHRVRKVDAATGIITTIAGNGNGAYNGDNIPATSASLYYPSGIGIDNSGNVYIADAYNNRIRKVDAVSGIITTVAGNGNVGMGNNVTATLAPLNQPSDVAIDSSGNIYIADQYNNRVCKVYAATGILNTVAGTGVADYNGDSISPTTAMLNYPTGITIDRSGQLYIADQQNNRVRKVTALNAFYVLLTKTDANCTAAGTIQSSVTGGTPPYTYLWSNGDTTTSISSIPPGTYHLTVTDYTNMKTVGYAVIQTECVSTIIGRVYNDANGNCAFDSTDQPLMNQSVEITTGRGIIYYANSDSAGIYTAQIPDSGIMYVSFANHFNGTCVNLSGCGNASDTIYISNIGDSISNVNIAIKMSSGFDLTMYLGWTSASPGFIKQYWVMPYNLTTLPLQVPVTVTFYYDSNLIYQGSTLPLPSVDTINHTLTWAVSGSTIPWGSYDWINDLFISTFLVPPSLSGNYQLQSRFVILPTAEDCNITNNTMSFSDMVTGSLDPNAKTVLPAAGITDADSILTYTIYFENTGSASTNFITVIDTLSPNVEPASVVNLASSAKYNSFTISGTGILTWVFNPLSLPAGAADSIASKGFITFSIHRKADLPTGAQISNSATIYFDYNTGIQTNTVTNTVAALTAVAATDSKSLNITAYPNPFGEQTHIIITGINQKCDFELFDLTGRQLLNFPNLQNNEFNLQRGNLPAGGYLYRIIVNDQSVGHGKLVVE